MNPLTGGPVHEMYRPKNTQPHHRQGQNDNISVLTNPEPVSTHFIPPQERFNRDFVAEERMRREQQQYVKEQLRNQRCQQMLERDAQRYQSMNQEDEKYNSRLREMEAKWKQGQKNSTSQAYNPITLEYDDTEQGRILRAQDEIKYGRRVERLNNLDAKRNSGYNLLTGESRPAPMPPPKPF